jgi:hypothetical protein
MLLVKNVPPTKFCVSLASIGTSIEFNACYLISIPVDAWNHRAPAHTISIIPKLLIHLAFRRSSQHFISKIGSKVNASEGACSLTRQDTHNPDESFRGLLQSLLKNFRTVPWKNVDRFLLHPLPIIYWASCHVTLHNLRYEKRRYINTLIITFLFKHSYNWYCPTVNKKTNCSQRHQAHTFSLFHCIALYCIVVCCVVLYYIALYLKGGPGSIRPLNCNLQGLLCFPFLSIYLPILNS